MKSLLVATFLPFPVSSYMPAVPLPLHRSTQLLVTHSCSRAEPLLLGSPALNSHTQVLIPFTHTYEKALRAKMTEKIWKLVRTSFRQQGKSLRQGRFEQPLLMATVHNLFSFTSSRACGKPKRWWGQPGGGEAKAQQGWALFSLPCLFVVKFAILTHTNSAPALHWPQQHAFRPRLNQTGVMLQSTLLFVGLLY